MSDLEEIISLHCELAKQAVLAFELHNRVQRNALQTDKEACPYEGTIEKCKKFLPLVVVTFCISIGSTVDFFLNSKIIGSLIKAVLKSLNIDCEVLPDKETRQYIKEGIVFAAIFLFLLSMLYVWFKQPKAQEEAKQVDATQEVGAAMQEDEQQDDNQQEVAARKEAKVNFQRERTPSGSLSGATFEESHELRQV